MNKLNFLLLQISDSSFPIGAFSHSFGLESYVNFAYIKNIEDAKKVLKTQLYSNILYFELLALKIAYENANDVENLLIYQRKFLSSIVAKEQSQAYVFLAKRFVKNVSLYGLSNPLLNQYIKENQTPIYPFVYALFCKDNELDFMYESFLFALMSNFINILVKIVPLSQNEGQILLFQLQQDFQKVLSKLQNLTLKDWCENHNILNDYLGIKHQNLAFKIYIS
ncbi:hypothetical protein L8V80_03320 [Campylobacter lari]|uniref:urease accessory protein UreF n=1 Tax=Campylobacter TaxID=194 RepID=UPI0021573DBF|nr:MULTISPECIES: urease accessory UreF family protein [Campylobacter]MCR6776630.1 hypothetical protein [Campylobacter lari]MCV3373959.1 hypothetical protein [Campylobacter lari]MCV3410442.1 hypothetical protein [Campylobacter lari]MCV3420633.1 hypothetical protein [Campylobacter lari]MCV3440246.1 hypothetical protein [Campylobacter lari]